VRTISPKVRKTFPVYVIISLFMFCLPGFAERVMAPAGVFYYQPAASVFGAEAAWVNPAGLARYNAAAYQIMFDYYDGAFAKSWGTIFTRTGLAVAHRKLHNPDGPDYLEYLLGAGLGLGQRLFLGGSYRYFKDAPDGFYKRHFWNIGFIEQSGGPVTWGATFSNLNRGKLNGQRTEIEMRYSGSVRPSGDKFTFSIDMLLSSRTRLSNADFVYHLEVNPTPGLYVNGYVDSDQNFQIGLRANLLKYFAGSKSTYNKNARHLGTTGFIGAGSLRQPSLIPEPERRLSLGLAGSVRENPPQPVWGHKPTPFVTLLMSIYRAAEDRSIGEMVLTLDGVSVGFGRAQELRQALQHFRSRNKEITCYIMDPDNLAYYIASAADRIFIPPVSQLNLVGLRAELTFYAGTMEKLGVKADLMRIGDYKTGAETYTREASSPENREQINRVLDSVFDQFLEAIANGRGLTQDSVRKIVDNGPYTSEEALRYGLVEGLSYRDDLKRNHLSKMPEIAFKRYTSDTLSSDGWPARPVLALVVAEGEIVSPQRPAVSLAASDKVTPSALSDAFRQVTARKSVAGVVFRIDSPGGWALAAEEIYHYAAGAAEKKPIVVSMGNVAASGGYHIAMAGEHLLASPATITGSIGIYGGKLDLSSLYDKINLGKEIYTRGRYAGMLSSVKPFSPQERDKYFSHMKAFYDYFVKLVADNRLLAYDSVDALSRGRVWTGQQALSNGLIDELGGIKQSLDWVARKTGVKDYTIEIYPRRRPWFIIPGNPYLKYLGSLFFGGESPVDGLTELTGLEQSGGLIARMPYDIEIE